MHSGQQSNFKIDCDALTDGDWETVARLIGTHLAFDKVVGVPQGGLKLAAALQPYCRLADTHRKEASLTLIVDDVCTTGASLEHQKELVGGHCVGAVLFARGKAPSWVWPVFQLQGPYQPYQEKER